MSVLSKIIPVFGSPGSIDIETALPLCIPTPEKNNLFFNVVCLT
jgi:hypothetical protein